MHAHTHYTHVHTPHAHTCTEMHTHTHVRSCTHIHRHVNIHMHTHIYTRTHIHTCTRTHACTQLHTSARTHTHTHTREGGHHAHSRPASGELSVASCSLGERLTSTLISYGIKSNILSLIFQQRPADGSQRSQCGHVLAPLPTPSAAECGPGLGD